VSISEVDYACRSFARRLSTRDLEFNATRKPMGRFDSRISMKMRRRKAQAKKKARAAKVAEVTREQRHGKKK
jgi:hypothetical protein